MEEKEAIQFHDELMRKGGNAAKFKHGLGFGSTSTSVPQSEAYGALTNFVREASPGRAAALRKEIKIETVRDKLKKRDDSSWPELNPGAHLLDDGRFRTVAKAEGTKGCRRRRTPDYDLGGRKTLRSTRRRSSSFERTERYPIKNSQERRRRSRSRSNDKISRSLSTSKAEALIKSSGKEIRRRSRSRSRGNGGRMSRSPGADTRKGREGRRRSRSSSTINGQKTSRFSNDGDGDAPEKISVKERRRSPSLSKSTSRSPSANYDMTVKKLSGTERRRSPLSSSERTAEKILNRCPSLENDKLTTNSGTCERQSRSKKFEKKGPSSRSPSNNNSGSDGRKNSRLGRDRSVSPVDEKRKRSSNDRSRRSRRSRSRSYEGRRRDRSRSRSRERDVEHRRSSRRDQAYSAYESWRRQRSRSPTSHRSIGNDRDSRRTGRPGSGHRDSSGRRNEDDRREERYSGKDRARETEADYRSSRVKEKPLQRDYSKLIPSFDSMTPAEKVKAKMKLQLSETVIKDKANGMSEEWERFDFNKDAPLDDDAQLDYFGDGTGAKDDTIFLKNAGSKFQASREAEVTAMHENAIFGPAEGLSLKIAQPRGEVVARSKGLDISEALPSDAAVTNRITNSGEEHQSSATPVMNSVISEQVIAMQQAGPWQERARKMRKAREAALAS